MKRIKNMFKKTVIWVVIFTTVFWSSSLAFMPPIARAAGGIDAMYTNDGGSPDVYLNASSTPESIIKITAYDTTAGTNKLNGVTIRLQAGMNCPMGGGQCVQSPFESSDLGALTTATTSGMSLWLDDGDNTFELNQDTLISSTTATQAGAWTTQTTTDPYGGTFTSLQTVFSNLNLDIPVSFASPLAIFVVARAENNINAATLHRFMPSIPQNGIDVTSASISDWPSESMGRMFQPVILATEGGGDFMDQSAPLVISEIQTASSTANIEFIEIYNTMDHSYDLMPSNGIVGADAAIMGNINLHIVDCTGTTCTGTTTNPILALTTNNDTGDDIPAHGYFLIASTDWNFGTADAAYDASVSGMATNGGVYISATSTANLSMIDKVGWGSQTQTIEGMATVNHPANGSLERKAYGNSTPTSMTTGIDAAKGNSNDTNNNSSDFITRQAGAAGPQNRLSAIESQSISSGDRNIVINEILYNTATTSAWIELYNASSSAISINNWTLNIATSTNQAYTIPNVSAASHGFVTIYWNLSGTDDTDTSDGQASLYAAGKAPMSTLGGDVTLKNAAATIIDYAQYGGPGKYGETAAAAAGQWTTGDFKPTSEYNQSIARMGINGDDYNSSGDWMYFSSPTAGLPNSGGDSTAPNTVNNVQLSDPDNAGFGINGGDVRISWLPSSTADSGFDRYEIYLLPDGTSLNTAQHSVYSTAYGQYMWENGSASSSYAITGGGFNMSFDSAGTALATGAYRAYVVAIDMAGNRSAAISSTPATLASENAGISGNDIIDPMIDHMNVWEAPTGQNLTFYARMGDDRDQCNIATSSIIWKLGNDAWASATTTACTIPAMAGNSCLRQCVINWSGTWNADTTIFYYLAAYDQANNSMFLGMYPTTTESEARNSVWTSSTVNNSGIDFVDSADWNDAGTIADLTGTVFNDSGTPLQDAFVIINGAATVAATTTSAGVFTIPDNAMRHSWNEIKVIKSGYMEQFRNTEKNSSSNSFYMSSGFMSTGSGGSSGGNGVAWTAPMDNMMMAPTNIACSGDCSTISQGQMPIVVSFFNNMNAATIDDMDASNAGSNIYITTDGNTKVSGIKVKYASASKEARIYSSTALSPNTYYTVVITSSASDTNGNPLPSNRSNGNYEFGFSTMSNNSSMWVGGGGNNYSNFASGGMTMPPYVKGTNPTPGQFNVPLSAVLTVEFSETMDPATINSIKLYRITSQSPWTGTEVTNKNVSVTLDSATKKTAAISHDALDANTANSGWYEIRVLANAKSQLGVWMGNPGSCGNTSPDTCLANTTHYTSSFQVSSVSDTAAPTVAGTFPANNDGITSSATVVDVAVSSLEIGFSEGMNPSSINSQNITLKKGTTNISGTVSYDPMTNNAKFSPTNALTANSAYTLTVTTGVTDLSGNALAANNIINFKTGSSDILSPEAMYANGDDYQVAITFTEPMNASAQTDTANWAYSVLNPANYYINTLGTSAGCANPGSWACNQSLVAPYNTVGGNQISLLNGMALSYDSQTQTVTLKGFGMCSGLQYAQCQTGAAAVFDFQIFIDNVKDKSGNIITDTGNRSGSETHRNASRSPMQNSATTYGMLGPGGGTGMMMSGSGSAGQASGPSMDMSKMGMFGAGAFPMNAMAGQTSNYMIDLPVTKALQDGMQIILTFPTGFNVSALAKDLYSPMNSDMNNWNGGTVAFDTTYGVGGIASTTLNTVTIKLDIATSSGNTLNSVAGPDGYIDSLHIDIKGVKNSSIPKDFGTSGYTVDIKTKSSDGALLENITTMPFYITQGGSNALTVVTNCGNVNQDDGTINVYLGSPMTGPMEAQSTTFENGIATSTFSNISNGQYMLFTDPFVTIGSNNYMGKPMPESIQISGNTTKNIAIAAENSGSTAAVSIHLTGNFSTDKNKDGDNLDSGDTDNVDIFANSPMSFRAKTVTPITDDGVGGTDGDGADNNGVADTLILRNATNVKYTNYLTEGEWNIGVGPAMPKGPMSGPQTMPDWMMPQNINITVGIETATGRTLGTAEVGNAESVLLNTASTNNFKTGDVVTFATGAAAATTTITAISPNASITVTPQGNWTILPSDTDTITSVRESSGGDNDSKIFFNIASQSLKNIYGFVVDDSGNGVSGAEIYAYQPQGSGGGHTTSDTAGRFTLKIGSNGVWTIGAFKPGMPNAKEKSVDVKDDTSNSATDGNSTADIYSNGTLVVDASNNNAGTNPLRLKLKRPSFTISGKVLNASSTPIAYSPVWAYQPSGSGNANAMTDSSGNYILYVDAGTWRIEADAPGAGWLQYDTDVTITTASQSNINLRPASDTVFHSISGTITIDGSAQAYMPLRAVKYTDSNSDGTPETLSGRDYGASTDSIGQFTISLPAGYYRIDSWTQNYGEIELVYDQFANSQANINVNAATTTANITVASADLQTISLQFNNGLATQSGFLHIEEMDFSSGYPKPTGYRLTTNITGLNATSTVKIKGSSAGKYYFFDLDVPGYGFFMPSAASRTLLSNDKDCIKVTNAARAVYFDLPNATTGVITVSGTIYAGTAQAGNELANAWVWLGNPNSQFHTGVQSGSAGTFSFTIPKLLSGNYNLGTDKPGYMSPAPLFISGSAGSTGNNIALTANTRTITGKIYTDTDNSGTYSTSTEAIANAWVWAEETTTKQMAYAPADATGSYELGVSNGSWQIYAGADGYTENAYRVSNTKTAITVAGSSMPNINVALSTNSNWTMKTKSKPITPSSGGIIDDTAASSTGVKLTIPPNALGSDSNSGNVSVTETSAVTETTSAAPLGGIGKSITATDNSGQAITNLNDYIDIEIIYYKSDIESMNIVGYSKLKSTNLSYWDNTLNNWINLSTSRKAYYKTASTATEWTLQADSATQTGYEDFIDTLAAGTPAYYDYKLVFTAQTNHLTVFGATQPQDNLLPSAPAGLTQSSGSGTSVALSWTAVSTNYDTSAITDLLGYQVYRCPASSDCSNNSNYTQKSSTVNAPTIAYSDTSGLSSFTSYYYKVTTSDDGGNETGLASSTALQLCSNTSVEHGIVASSCAITCDTGYTQSGNSCVSSGGAVIQTGGGGSSSVSCSQVVYDDWQTACAGGWQYRNVKSQTPSGCGLTTAQENDRKKSCGTTTATTTPKTTLPEIIQGTKDQIAKIAAPAIKTAAEFAKKVIEIAAEASEIIKADINSLLGKFGFKRDLAKEDTATKQYVKNLIKGVKSISTEKQAALNNFIAYGTDTTIKLGEGERAGVVNSYKSAFGKLPATSEEWSDAIKIANGRWPSEKNVKTETAAIEAFKKIYKREPNRSNANDDAAVTIISYGLRPTDRNLNSEKAAIKSFKAIYEYAPKSATAWDIVRAIAYSGAKR